MFCTFSDAHLELNNVLEQCEAGMNALHEHENTLFEKSLLSFSPSDWSLLDMEQSLFHLGAVKDLTKGVFYCLAVPSQQLDTWTLR